VDLDSRSAEKRLGWISSVDVGLGWLALARLSPPSVAETQIAPQRGHYNRAEPISAAPTEVLLRHNPTTDDATTDDAAVDIEPIVLASATPVEDIDLANMRGRFVQGGQVAYFGIQMATSWQTAEGVVLNASLSWQIDLSSPDVNPTVSFFHSADGQPPDAGAFSTGDVVVTANAGGLEQAQGVVQSVQAAGDLNSIGNSLSVGIVQTDGAGGAVPPPPGTAFELTETTTVQFDSGASATAFVDDNGVGLALQIGDIGTVIQEIRSNPGRIAQHANITSNLNLVRNAMQVSFGIDPGVEITRANLGAALNLLRDLGT
jgi:hypothetical protein